MRRHADPRRAVARACKGIAPRARALDSTSECRNAAACAGASIPGRTSHGACTHHPTASAAQAWTLAAHSAAAPGRAAQSASATFQKAVKKVLKSERNCHISLGPVPFAPAPAGATTTAAGGGDAQPAAQSLGISSREMPRRSSARGGRGSGRGRYGGSGGADGGDDDMTVAACLARCGVADASELAECDGLDAEWRRVKRVYFKKVLHCPGGARGGSWAHRA